MRRVENRRGSPWRAHGESDLEWLHQFRDGQHPGEAVRRHGEQGHRFHLLHATCGTRLKQVRWCPTDEVEVPWSETVRGYEYAKGQYVMLTDEDFENLPLPSKHTIELSAFVEESEIDPVFYEKSYYLEPGERAQKPYALLLKALEKKSLTAIATITIRKKEQLCAIRAARRRDHARDAVLPGRGPEERGRRSRRVRGDRRELEMAFTLIELLHKPFDPEEYHDHYREALGSSSRPSSRARRS